MKPNFLFILNSVLLGIGLSADAFSLSVVNGSRMPEMKTGTCLLVSGVFAVFQGFMPMLGRYIAAELISCFAVIQVAVPYISQILLIFLGLKIISEGRKSHLCRCPSSIVSSALLVQALATSVDALLAGITLTEFCFSLALLSALIIAFITFVLCFIGVHLGRLLGAKLQCRASLCGGVMLILIALENFIRAVSAL